MTIRLLPLALAVLVAGGAAPRAEDFLGQLDLVRQLYDEGDYAAALTELDFARQMLREKLAEQYAATFPAPPEGWRAEEARSQSGAMFGGGTMLTRSYRRGDGRGYVEAQILADNPMVQTFAAMMNDPAMIAAEPGAERVRIGRRNAVLTWDASSRSGEMRLLVGRALIQLEGQDLDDRRILVDLMEGFDLETLRKLSGD